MPICHKHNIPKVQIWGTKLFVCPECEKEKRRISSEKLRAKNKALLEQSTFATRKVAKNGLKSKKKKFNFYKTTAWKWFSRYVLLYYANKNGIVRCATSGRLMKINSRSCHTGHFIKVNDMNSTNYYTAFDFRNVAPQYYQDNRYGGGRMDLMREFLVTQHGEEAIKDLEQKRKIPFHLDTYTLNKIADEYKAKFYALLEERNIENPWKK
jgi:hypothetical protein